MKTVWKQVEEAASTLMISQPITKVHGRPTRQNYITWKKDLERAANQIEIDETYPWSVDATGNNYGGMKLTMEDNEYELRTGITTFAEPTEPVQYDPAINANTPTFQRKQMEQEHEQTKHDYWTWKGASKGLAERLRGSMERQYYSELEHHITGFRAVTTLEILDHIAEKWAPMDPRAKKQIKDDYYRDWDIAGGQELSAFTKALDTKKDKLVTHNITISEEEMKDHYVVNMYSSGIFSQATMTDWEGKTEAQKDDWVYMKRYFRQAMIATDTFTNNSNAIDKTKYNSSGNINDESTLADMGDELRDFIANITNAKGKENAPPDNSNKEFDDMKKQMAELKTLLMNMSKNNKDNNNGGGGGDKGDGKVKKDRSKYINDKPMEKARNMGAYCHSCGYHPVGENHTSANCPYKRSGHDDNATWANRGTDGSKTWPREIRVREDQRSHATYKDKERPTN